jgi:hypothetical protein
MMGWAINQWARRVLGCGWFALCVASVSLAAQAAGTVVRHYQQLPPASDGPMAVLPGAAPQLVLSGLHRQGEQASAQLTMLDLASGMVQGQYQFAAGRYQGFAVASLAGPAGQRTRPAVVLLGAEGMFRLAPSAGGKDAALQPLFQCPHSFVAVDADHFALLPVTLDVNADGLSDFLLPGFTQQCLAVQQADGRFVTQLLQLQLPVELHMPPFERATLQLELPADWQLFDINADQRLDILLGTSQRAGYFLQQADGRFATQLQPLPLPVRLAGSERQVKQFKQLTRFQFLRFEDLNQDGLPDVLLLQKQYGNDISDSQPALRVLYGAMNAQQFGFAPKQGLLPLPGEMLAVEFADFNGDRRAEASLLSAELSAGSLMSVLTGSGVALDIQVFAQLADGQFASEAVLEQQSRYTLDVGTMNHGVLFSAGHFTADVYADLLFINQKQQLQLLPGSAGGWLNRKPQRLDMPLPAEQKLISVLDTNLDGISELLLRERRTDGSMALRIVSFAVAEVPQR